MESIWLSSQMLCWVENKFEVSWEKEMGVMNKEKTGELIREARIKKNYTQSELGDLLGVTNKAVSRWEKGV